MRSPARSRSYDALRAQLDENLRLLRRDGVDTLQVHESDEHTWWTDTPPDDPNEPLDPDYDFAGAPVVKVLRDAKSEGLCRFTGVTGNTAGGVGLALANVDVDVCLTAFNYDILRRRSRRELIPLAKAKNASVVLGAVIRLPGDMPEQLERLSGVARESGISVLELTLRYLLADRDVTAILVGASKPAEIEESVGAAEKGPLPPALHQTLEELGDS
jgi:aryl-alcohol dehydrogenase-like predicted oxidoreductase